MNEKNRKLPVGIDNFELLRKKDFYYVDKTELIRELMNNWGSVNLFTRPRRFRKTLKMSMLRSFFEIGGDKSIFDGLAVSRGRSLCEKYMGKFPVVFLTLKGLDGLTFEMAYQSLCEIVIEEISRLRILADSERQAMDERQYIANMLNGTYMEIDIRM